MKEIVLEKLNTEQQNPNTNDIDICSTYEILKKINDEDKKIADIVDKQIPSITKLVDAVYECIKNGGRIIYVGAGTSGRIGILDASECPPTYGVSHEVIQGIIAGGNDAIFKAKEGAEDSKTQCIDDLKNINFSKNDMVIGLAASGRTPYVIGAIKYANDIGALTGSICCVENGDISKFSKYPIEIVTGAEVITGSTRMKAGTAQKMVLNMISTTAMIKMGKVFNNLMVDLKPTNKKLEIRACNIIKTITNVDEKKAEQLFLESDKNIKIAIIMGMTNCDLNKAISELKSSNGHIKNAIKNLLKEEY